MSLSFELLGTDGMARRGRIGTAHGTVETPAFMPLGTGGTVKAMLPQSVAETGSTSATSRSSATSSCSATPSI